MRKHTKSLVLKLVIGAFGLFLAHSARADTRTWNSKTTDGVWSEASNWGGMVPAEGDTVKFTNGTLTATFDMDIVKVAGVTKNGTGTATLAGLPSSFKLGEVTQTAGSVTFGWDGDAPTDPMTSLTVSGNASMNLGGAVQTVSGMPVASGKQFTLRNGTLTTGWDRTRPLTIVVGTGATWNINQRLRVTETEAGQNIFVKDGGVMNLTSGDAAYAGLWYKARKMTITCSNGGVFNSKKANFNVGWGGTGVITNNNATLDFGTKTVCCTRPTDKTDTSSYKTTYNGVATFVLRNNAVLKAGGITFGYDQSASKDYGSFTLDAAGGSKLYIGSLVANGATANTITFDDVTIVPSAANGEFLIQGHENLTKQYIKVTAGGLTIDNENANNVTIDERLANVGPVTAKMYGGNFTLRTYVSTTGKVTFENPGVIALECEQQAFPADSTVAIDFTEEPVAANEPGRALVTWAEGMQPANVTFALDAQTAKKYELVITPTGINIQKIGFEAAAFAEWKGGNDRDANAVTNWTFRNASGAILENGYVGGGTVFTYGGGSPRFNVTNGSMLADHVFLITDDVSLPAARDWSGFDAVRLADGVTLDENGFKLKLAGDLSGANEDATVCNGGDLDFTVATGDQKLLGPMTLDGVTNIIKRGAGVLTATNLTLRTRPALTLVDGTMAFDWSGLPVPTNFLSGLSASGETTLDLGGASQTVAGVPLETGATLTLNDGTLTTGWIGKDKDAQNSDRTIKVVGANAEWIVDGALRAEQCKNEAYVSDGGTLTVLGASVLGDWYNTRSFKIYIEDGTFNHCKADLTIGSTGVGLVQLDNSTLNAQGRTIKASVKTAKSGKHSYNGDATLTLRNGAVLRAKDIVYGDDEGTIDDTKTEFTLSAIGNSKLYIESLTAAGRTKDAITFNGATVVPTASGVLFRGAANLERNYITVGANGLIIDNQLTNTVTIAETLKGAGLVTFNLNGADLTITEPQQCTNIKFVNPGLVKLTGDATFAAGTTITFDYTDKQFVKRSKIVTWEAAQPDNLTVTYASGAEAITGRKLVKYPSGISFKVGFVLTFR